MPEILTAEELMAPGQNTVRVPIPDHLLGGARDGEPGGTGGSSAGNGGGHAGGGSEAPREVVLRPLLIRDVERVSRAARDQRVLTSVLMVQQALVSPALTVEQVGNLPAGLVQFLLERVNRISGLTVDDEELEQAVRAPLTRACFILAREFGWTPAECSELTVGQVLLYLEMLAGDENAGERE